jgi:hypothetical protein
MRESTMVSKESIDRVGTPAPRHIYAVFDNAEAYRHAEQELIAIGIQPEKLEGDDASAQQPPPDKPGLLKKVERFLKSIGGETNMAKRYAEHLQQSHIVLAAPVPDVASVEKIAKIVTNNGGYEVTHFGDWTITYLSPSENIAHGAPTHSTTNTDG